jgi:hypothetical protein
LVRPAPAAPETLPLPSDEGLRGSNAKTRRRVLLAVGATAVIGILGVLAFFAWSNYDRAGRWEARAATLERNNRSLNAILISRSEKLNARTLELNGMAAKVRRAETTIARSEADVQALERRQRELANEKAQVEDARSQLAAEQTALEGVAAAYVDCKSGLVDLLSYVTADDYASASAAVDQVAADCQYADSSLQNYQSTYG